MSMDDMTPFSGRTDFKSPASNAELDMSRYWDDMKTFALSDNQKRELLESLWEIMRGFVDLGFDVGKVDLCGQLFGAFNQASNKDSEGVESSSSSITEKAHNEGKDGP